jgi:hypothetical protein
MTNNMRCYDHRNAANVTLCATCQRINVEQQIVIKTVQTLLAAGYQLNVFNGGDEPELPTDSSDLATVTAAMMETDDEKLAVSQDGHNAGWVYFVYGNSGWDVISDYTTNLEDVLQPVIAFADTFEV